jgi:hypothetical protein
LLIFTQPDLVAVVALDDSVAVEHDAVAVIRLLHPGTSAVSSLVEVTSHRLGGIAARPLLPIRPEPVQKPPGRTGPQL